MSLQPSEPVVSVVIAAYNAERWLSETLASVLAQRGVSFEVLVVDDGSTDGTARLAQSYGPPVRCVRKPNGGQPSARNAGIREARGRYVAFIDSDDLWEPEKLQRQVEALERGYSWAYCDAVFFDSDTGRVRCRASHLTPQPEGDVLRELLIGNFILSPTPIVERKVFDEIGFFDESPELRIGEDWNMWLRIAASHPVACVRQPLARIRKHSESMTSNLAGERFLKSYTKIIDAAVARTPSLQSVRDQALATVHVKLAAHGLARGEHLQAARHCAEAIRLHPRGGLRPLTYLAFCATPKPVVGWVRQARVLALGALSRRSVAPLRPTVCGDRSATAPEK